MNERQLTEIWRGGAENSYYVKCDGQKFIAGRDAMSPARNWMEIGYCSNISMTDDSHVHPKFIKRLQEILASHMGTFDEYEYAAIAVMRNLHGLASEANRTYNRFLGSLEYSLWKEFGE